MLYRAEEDKLFCLLGLEFQEFEILNALWSFIAGFTIMSHEDGHSLLMIDLYMIIGSFVMQKQTEKVSHHHITVNKKRKSTMTNIVVEFILTEEVCVNHNYLPE